MPGRGSAAPPGSTARCRPAGVVTIALLVGGCPSPVVQSHPEWQRITVDYGQGYFQLPARYHWVAVRTEGGVEIQSQDGGDAAVRIFACGETIEQVQGRIRRRLRDRFIGSDFRLDGRVFSFSWRRKPSIGGPVVFTTVAPRGPLLITATSSTIEPDDVVHLASGTHLGLPIPSIQSCLPVCLPKEEKGCKPDEVEDEE